MNELIQWGLEIVRWIQTFRNPLLDQFFLTINFLGDEEFYLLFFPLIFWCFHKAIGYRLAFLFLVSAWTNAFFKNVFAAPRPHDVDPKLYAPIKTTGYGIPSGHTQGTVVTWGNLATQLKTRAWWTLAILIPLFVGIGRMYLGDHFPQDVLAGAGLGVLLVVGYALVQPRLGEWVASQSIGLQLGLAVLLPVALAIVYLDTAAVPLGALAGFGIGLVLEEKYVRFSPRGEWWKQIIKLVIGMAIAFGLRIALKAVLGDAALMNLARYAIIGFWLAFGAPWVFVQGKLAVGGKQ